MLRRFSVDFAIFMMAMDAVLVSLALYLSTIARLTINTYFPIAKEFTGPYFLTPLIYPLFAGTWVFVLILFSAYDARKHLRVFEELISYTLGSILAAVSLAGLLYLTFRDFSRALFAIFVILGYGMMLVVRLIYRFMFRRNSQRDDQNNRRILVIGAGVVGKQVADNILEYYHLGLRLAGFLDDDPGKQEDKLVLGGLDDIRKIVKQYQVDDVVMALPQRAFHRANQMAIELHDMPVRVWVVPDYFSLALNQAGMEDLAGIPMIDLRAPALNDYQRMVKRIFDVTMAILMLPFLIPVMGVITIVIRLDSRGPAIFKQKRIGENGRIFSMYKFRTMVDNAENMRQVIERVNDNGLIIQDKTLPDPRITKVGRFLRQTSLDEFPQIFNVLRGEMSLVGPRPELPYLVDQYETWQRARFAVPQGMTGWWQVNGRSDKPMHLHTEDDLYYVEHYSIWLDLFILLRTFIVIIRRKGAY